MKPFKLNKFEKFIIGHRKLSMLILFIIYLAVTVACAKLSAKISILDTVILIIALSGFMFLNIFPAVKHDKIVKAAQEDLDINYAYDALCEFCTAVNPKDTATSALFFNNKLAYLINMGKYQEALEQYKAFFDIFGTRKTPPQVLFTAHANYATLQYELGNYEQSKAHFKTSADFYNFSKASKNIIVTPEFNEIHRQKQNEYTAYYGDFDPEFENKALHDMKFTCKGKAKKKISALEKISAYNDLFTYFKRFGNTEKAKYYAEKILDLGNEQLADYRRAKEYLENADESN